MSENVVIVAAARTPVGSFGGSLASLPATALGTAVIKVCGSGLKAVHLAMQAVACGDADKVNVNGGASSWLFT